MNYDADVIVIGAGGGGAVVAKELGEKGVKVVVLEAGPWYGNKQWPEPNREIGAIGSSNYEDLDINILKQQFTDLEDDMNDSVSGKFRWGPADRTKPPWPRILYGEGFAWQNAGVGGSTLHYFGNSPRAYPQAVDNIWPIPYEELVPYYEKVEATLPVNTAPRTAKEDLFTFGLIKAGFEPLTSPNVTTPGYRQQPNAILQVNPQLMNPDFDIQNNRTVGCTLKGHCINGCNTGPTIEGVAKRSTFVSYIPKALQTGNVTVRPNTFVIKVLTEEDDTQGIHAVGVEYKNTWKGETGRLNARVIVMSAGAVETPRLWLNSNLPKNPWVGKGLINHWFDCMGGIFDENAIMDAIGVSDIKPYVGQNATTRLDYPGLGVIEIYGLSPGIYSYMLYGTSGSGYAFLNENDSVVTWNTEGLVVGEQLKEFMRNYNRTMAVLIFTDDEVRQENSVTLDPILKDENGYIPVIKYTPDEATRVKRDTLAKIAADIFRRAGAKTVIRANWQVGVLIHIQSTMRIGLVTDINCEANQVKRLYIADNSVIYNGIGGPNPTLTNQALATRTAEKIVEKYFNQTSMPPTV